MGALAIIPARVGSKGIPGKNIRPLAGRSPLNRTIAVCEALRDVLDHFVITTDFSPSLIVDIMAPFGIWHQRPQELAQDDTPMEAVIRDVLAQHLGDPIVVLQPTQPLRCPEHVRQALTVLRAGASSVVSVVPVPPALHPDRICVIKEADYTLMAPWATRRQDCAPAYYRDGTVYACTRASFTEQGFYGHPCRPLVIPRTESCPLDEPEDWEVAEWRLKTAALPVA